ncbi:MAG: NUDIX domain-containing protein [Firmicutes bacterium]|nr:NUDIX domain-containing protein [Bacillota bacterium]
MIICKGILGEEKTIEAKDLKFAVSVYAVAIRENKILISPQWCDNGYDFPGGHIDLGEVHTDALVREVKEETGMDIKPGNPIAVGTSFFVTPRRKECHQSVQIYFEATVVGGEISTSGFDEGESAYAKEAKFVTLKELKKMKWMNTNQKPMTEILRYLEGKTK